MKWIVLLIGTATVACDARCERAVLLFVKYSTWPAPNIRCVGFGRWLVYMLVGIILQRVMAYLRAI